jgi:hypothetical protein
MKSLTVVSALAAVAIAAVMLSGCSAIRAVTDAQTKVQACAKIRSSFANVGQTLSTESANLATDPSGASATITAAADKFTTDADSLSNAQVKKAAEGASTWLTIFSEDVSNSVKFPTPQYSSKVSTDLPKLQASFTALTTTCSF